MSAPLVRPARFEDAADLVVCYAWLFAPPGATPTDWSPDRAADRLRAVIDGERSTVLVAEVDGALVGFASVYLTLISVRFGQEAWVEDLAVDPDRRSGGVGRRLLAAATDWARARGADRLGLESGLARTDAHRFYERQQPDAMARSFAWTLSPDPGA